MAVVINDFEVLPGREQAPPPPAAPAPAPRMDASHLSRMLAERHERVLRVRAY